MKILIRSLNCDIYNQVKITYKKGCNKKKYSVCTYIMIFRITWFIHYTDLDLSKCSKYNFLPWPQRREESHFLSVHINFINTIVFTVLSRAGSV